MTPKMAKQQEGIRSTKLPVSQHKKLVRLSADHDKSMMEILVEAVDLWELHRAGKPIPPPKQPLDRATPEQLEKLEAYLYVLEHAKEPELVTDVVDLWARKMRQRS
jgi:hypothetical protein